MVHDHENRYVRDIDSKFERVNDRLIENAADRADGEDIAETRQNNFRRDREPAQERTSCAWILTCTYGFRGFPFCHGCTASPRKALIALEHGVQDRILFDFLQLKHSIHTSLLG